MRTSRIVGAILGLILSGLIAGLHISGITSHAELPFRDRWIELRGPLAPPPQIAIVGVDDRSLGPDRPWPWPDHLLVQLIESIEREEPTLLVLTSEWSNLYGRKGQPLGEMEKLRTHRNLVLPDRIDRAPDAAGSLRVARPIVELSALSGAIVPADARVGVLREIPTSYEVQGEALPVLEVVVARRWVEATGGTGLLKPLGPTIGIDFIGPPGTVPYVPAEKWLQGEAPSAPLKGKIVFVGSYLSSARHVAWTPGSSSGSPMSEAEWMANGVSTLIEGRGVREVPAILVAIVFLLLGTILLPVFGLIGIVRAITLLVLIGLSLLVGFHELALRGWMAPVLTTEFLVLSCFLAALPIRSLRVAESIRTQVLAAPLVPHEGASIALVEGGQRFWGEVALESRRMLDFDALCFIVRSPRSSELGLVRSEGMEPTRIRAGAWRLGKSPFRDAVASPNPVECPPLFDDPDMTSYLAPFLYRGEPYGFLALGTKRGRSHMGGRAEIVRQICLAIATELRRREGRAHLAQRGTLSLSALAEKTVLAEVAGLEETFSVAQAEREIMDVALRHADSGIVVADVFGRVTRMSPGVEGLLVGLRGLLGWGVDDLPGLVAAFTGESREQAIERLNDLLGTGVMMVLDAAVPPERKQRVVLCLDPVSRRMEEGEGDSRGRVLAIVGSIRHPAEERVRATASREIAELLSKSALDYLSAIQGFTDILGKSGGLVGATREYLAAIQSNVKDVRDVLKKALEKLPTPAGAASSATKTVPVGDMCRELVEAMAAEARKKGVALLFEAPQEDCLGAESANERVRSAMRALLVDLIARSANSDTIEVSVRREIERLRIQVIWASVAAGSAEALKQIADSARSAYGVAGDNIKVSPDPGLGARFLIWLPAAKQADPPPVRGPGP